MNTRKTVTVKGITWTILSANERCTTVNGRHFFASRCSSKGPWYLREHDCSIITSEVGAREVGYAPFLFTTGILSQAVQSIIIKGKALPKRKVGDGVPLSALVSGSWADWAGDDCL